MSGKFHPANKWNDNPKYSTRRFEIILITVAVSVISFLIWALTKIEYPT